MKKLLSIMVLSITILMVQSCANEPVDTVEIKAQVVNLELKKDTKLKEAFGFALSKALKDSKDLRDFIKAEALKQVTGDYDVVYQSVKNKSVLNIEARGTNALTVREILIPFFQNEAKLIEIENALPYLTIFVPDLQGGSFSAVNWDTTVQIPFVGIRSYESDDVKIIKYTGETQILDKQYMPDFPVVVIKDNERLVSNSDLIKYNSLDTNILTEPTNPIQLRLASTNFQIIITNPLPPVPPGPRVDQIHANAYNVYGNYTPGGWQRDYIYYGLTPTVTAGELNPSYREHITSFQLSGIPAGIYSWISSNQDPALVNQVFTSLITSEVSGWTEGFYVFKILSSYGAKNSNNGTDEYKFLSVKPIDIFSIEFTNPGTTFGNMGIIKKPVINGLKRIDLYNGAYYGQRLEFAVWDLYNFSNQWKLSFEEADSPIEISTQYTGTNKSNANFAIEPSTGILKKIGLKFGASLETTYSNVYITKQTDISDPLGNSVINFYDNVVNFNAATNTLVPRTYSTGQVIFEFRPKQVQ
jgi:hypothetical protein